MPIKIQKTTDNIHYIFQGEKIKITYNTKGNVITRLYFGTCGGLYTNFFGFLIPS